MGYIYTYVLTVHDDDLTKVNSLNKEILSEFKPPPDLNSPIPKPPFFNVGARIPLGKKDLPALFYARIRGYEPERMTLAFNRIDWIKPDCVSARVRSPFRKAWDEIGFAGMSLEFRYSRKVLR